MNPLVALLMQLMRQYRHAPMQQGRAGDAMTPKSRQTEQQLMRDFYNPGGGWIGNDIVGGGQVFGGLYRGAPLSSYQGVQPNVGNVSWLGGGAPGQYGSGFQQAPAWGAQNWIQDLLHMSQANQSPYGNATGTGVFGTPSGMITGENPEGQQGAQYHGGGQGMLDFLRGTDTLQGMDERFRGGGGDDGGFGFGAMRY